MIKEFNYLSEFFMTRIEHLPCRYEITPATYHNLIGNVQKFIKTGNRLIETLTHYQLSKSAQFRATVSFLRRIYNHFIEVDFFKENGKLTES